MKIKCDYCGNFINETDATCPTCGGVNDDLKRVANGVPTTIEDLKLFCEKHNLPLSQMRFFIGENYQGPKAFGIYKDELTGNFVVYKNKSNGSRAIRYEGKDEIYAVNEIYIKLKEEIDKQKRHQNMVKKNTISSSNTYTTNSTRNYSSNTSRKKVSPYYHYENESLKGFILLITIAIIIFICYFSSCGNGIFNFTPSYNNSNHNNSNTYYYDNEYDDDDYNNNYNYYYEEEDDYNDDDYYDDYDYDDYDYNDYDYGWDDYDYDDSWDSDWDSGYDWDSGDSWDSGYSDWDSDW